MWGKDPAKDEASIQTVPKKIEFAEFNGEQFLNIPFLYLTFDEIRQKGLFGCLWWSFHSSHLRFVFILSLYSQGRKLNIF